MSDLQRDGKGIVMNDQDIYREAQRALQSAQGAIVHARNELAGANYYTTSQWIDRAVTDAKNAKAFIGRFGEDA